MALRLFGIPGASRFFMRSRCSFQYCKSATVHSCSALSFAAPAGSFRPSAVSRIGRPVLPSVIVVCFSILKRGRKNGLNLLTGTDAC